MPKYVSGWCEHGFKSHSQSFLLTYTEADLSLWRLVFYVSCLSGHGFESYSQPFFADIRRGWFKLKIFCLLFSIMIRTLFIITQKTGCLPWMFWLGIELKHVQSMIKGATRRGLKRSSAPSPLCQVKVEKKNQF